MGTVGGWRAPGSDPRLKVTDPDKQCPFCRGYGDIWVNWHPTPVKCGHCDGTGKAPEEKDAVR